MVILTFINWLLLLSRPYCFILKYRLIASYFRSSKNRFDFKYFSILPLILAILKLLRLSEHSFTVRLSWTYILEQISVWFRKSWKVHPEGSHSVHDEFDASVRSGYTDEVSVVRQVFSVRYVIRTFRWVSKTWDRELTYSIWMAVWIVARNMMFISCWLISAEINLGVRNKQLIAIHLNITPGQLLLLLLLLLFTIYIFINSRKRESIIEGIPLNQLNILQSQNLLKYG